jgi:hypothetical protein
MPTSVHKNSDVYSYFAATAALLQLFALRLPTSDTFIQAVKKQKNGKNMEKIWKKYCTQWDSIHRPLDPQSDALSTELSLKA